LVSSSAFSSPSQGTVRAVINSTTTDVDTGLQTADAPSFSGITLTGGVSSTITGSLIVSRSGAGVGLEVTGSARMRTGSVLVYTDQLVSPTGRGGLYLQSGSQTLALEVGGGTVGLIGSSTTNVNLYAQGTSVAFIEPTTIRPDSDAALSLGTSTARWNGSFATISASVVSASSGITGSLAQFNPVSLKITVGTTAPSTPATNDLWVDTN
jgi:hypothetical protein